MASTCCIAVIPEQQWTNADQFTTTLRQLLVQREVTELVSFEVEGKAMQAKLAGMVQDMGIGHRLLPSMFLCDRQEFADFLDGRSRAQMASFYKFQRTRLNILVDAEGSPAWWSLEFRRRQPQEIAEKHRTAGAAQRR